MRDYQLSTYNGILCALLLNPSYFSSQSHFLSFRKITRDDRRSSFILHNETNVASHQSPSPSKTAEANALDGTLASSQDQFRFLLYPSCPHLFFPSFFSFFLTFIFIFKLFRYHYE